jgi:hypothetical protein
MSPLQSSEEAQMNDTRNTHIENKSKVVSLEFGVGQIVGNFSMYNGIDDYLEIEYLVDRETRYFCDRISGNVRLVSSRASIERALIQMSFKLNDSSVENVFDETVSFLDKNVTFIVRRIVDLSRRKDLSYEDSCLLCTTIASLVSEVQEVYQVDYQQAEEFVGGFLKCA